MGGGLVEVMGSFKNMICCQFFVYPRSAEHIEGVLCLFDEVAPQDGEEFVLADT